MRERGGRRSLRVFQGIGLANKTWLYGLCRMPVVPATIADTIIRRCLRSLIEKNAGWKVCGEAENGAAAVAKVRRFNPNVVILDLSMPIMNGLEAARRIAAIAPNTSMLMFTMHSPGEVLKLAQPLGIKDVLSKLDGFPGNLIASLEVIGQQSGDQEN